MAYPPICAASVWLSLMILVQAGVTFAADTVPATPSPPSSVQHIQLRRAIVNLETAGYTMKTAARRGTTPPDTSDDLYFGSIMRRLPGEDVHTAQSYVEFCARYRDGIAVQAWCDRNFNHDLTDDPPVTLSGYPDSPESRSFLVDLAWTGRRGWKEYPIQEKVRVVLEAMGSAPTPAVRVQHVYGMLGAAAIDGASRPIVLFDGNGDGLYGPEFGDGFFVDLDASGHFAIDQLGPEFVPFSVPVAVGGHRCQVTAIDPEGHWLDLEDRGACSPELPAEVGAMAPELDAPSATGEALRLADHRGRWTALYFWASWCGNCAAQAPQLAELRKLYPAVDVIGVSFDSDRREMERFRATYSETWPTTFSGRMLWEDPAGKRYRIKGPGVICLIDPRGVLDGTYGSIGDVMARVSGNPVGVAGRWQSAAGSNKEVKHEP